LAAAPCTAMVFVWSNLTDGEPNFTLTQVALNDTIMVFAFAPIVGLLPARRLSSASSQSSPGRFSFFTCFAVRRRCCRCVRPPARSYTAYTSFLASQLATSRNGPHYM